MADSIWIPVSLGAATQCDSGTGIVVAAGAVQCGVPPDPAELIGGVAGPAGPNVISDLTKTTLQGILMGHGAFAGDATVPEKYHVVSAQANYDYLAPASYLPLETSVIGVGDAVSLVSDAFGRPRIDLTDASDATSARTFIGIVTSLDDRAETGGYLVAQSGIADADTAGMATGVEAWVDQARPGKLTGTRPTDAAKAVRVGVVTVGGSVAGAVTVEPQLPELELAFNNWLDTTPPLYAETDPIFTAWLAANPFDGYATESWVEAKNYLTIANAAATYLTITTAAGTYLTIASASSTYETKSHASSTYLTITTAAGTYLTITDAGTTYETKSHASSTYLTIASASSTYETQAHAAATYQLKGSYLTVETDPVWTADKPSYLTGASAAATYLSIINAASTYLTIASASSTYETKSHASSTYLTIANAASTYLTITTAAATYETQSHAAATYQLKGSYLTAESDPLSVHLNQSTPQTLSGGAFSGSGLLKITSGLLGVDTNSYLTSASLSGYATQVWVGQQGYLTSASLSGYATQVWVGQQGYLTSASLSGYATQVWVGQQGYLTSASLSGYATESWVNLQGFLKSYTETDPEFNYWLAGDPLNGYATESWVNLQGFITAESDPDFNYWLAGDPLSGYATESWVGQQGYLTAETDPVFSYWLAGDPFAGLATESWVGQQGYLTAETDPVFNQWLAATPPIYSESDPEFNYWLAGDPLNGYATESWVGQQGFITAETDPLSLHLNQTTPQTVTNGQATFADGFKLGTSPTVDTFAEGKIYYDSTAKTPVAEVGTASSFRLLQHLVTRVYNDTGSSIAKGTAVKIQSSTPGRIDISPAMAGGYHSTAWSSTGGVVTFTLAKHGYTALTLVRVNDSTSLVALPNGTYPIATVTADTFTVAIGSTATTGTATVSLPNQVAGLTSDAIGNGEFGFIINNGILTGLTLNTFGVGDILYLSDQVPGAYVVGTTGLSYSSRSNLIGYVIATGSSTGQIYVSIANEDASRTLTSIEKNILDGNVISTGVYDFGGITLNGADPTHKVDIAAAKGWIVENTGAFAIRPAVQNIIYAGQTGITPAYLNTADFTYMMLDSDGQLYQQATFPTPEERRDRILIGRVSHPSRSTILIVNNTVDYDNSPMSALRDMFSPIVAINEGVTAYPDGHNLNFNTSAGSLWGMGINWVGNQKCPNKVSISAATPRSFFYRTRTGGSTPIVSAIDPTHYDVAGTVTAFPGGNDARATNQRIYMAAATGVVNIQYGQQIYKDMATALAAQQTETFVKSPNITGIFILIGILAVRHGAADLSLSTDGVFVPASMFGENVGGVNGISTTTLQQAYNNSITPEIVTDATLGALTLKRGSAADTDSVFEVMNANSDLTAHITGAGAAYNTSLSVNMLDATMLGKAYTVLSCPNGYINLMMTDSATDASGKNARMGIAHYNNSDAPFSIFYGYSAAAQNVLIFGGGTGAMNAATQMAFSTGATTTTTAGTQRMSIGGTGIVDIGGALFSGTGRLNVTGTDDRVQFKVQGYSTQTNDVAKFGNITGGNYLSVLSSGGLKFNGTAGTLQPAADSTTAIQIFKADGITPVINIDTTNIRLGIGTSSPTGRLDVLGRSTSYPGATVTAGDLVVDTDTHTVYIGRQSDVSGDNTLFVGRDRLGNVKLNWGFAAANNIRFPAFSAGYGVGIGNGITDAQTTASLNIKGFNSTSANNALNVLNSTGTQLFLVRNDGVISVGATGTGLFNVTGTGDSVQGKFQSYSTQTNDVLQVGDISGGAYARFSNLGTMTIAGGTTTAITDILVNPAVKASGNFIDFQIANVSKARIDYNGTGVFPAVGTNSIYATTSATTLSIQPFGGGSTSSSATGINAMRIGSGSEVNARIGGQNNWLSLLPVYNQGTGAATSANTDFLINRTETRIGSGAQLFVDWQVGGVSRGKLDTLCHLTLGAGTTAGAPLNIPAGTHATVPVSGNVEADGTNLYYTTSTPTRKTLAFVGDTTAVLAQDAVVKDPTGFLDSTAVTITYNTVAKTITLTGTLTAYWQGVPMTTKVGAGWTSGWTSDAIAGSPVAPKYLYYDGSNFVWSDSIWAFDMLHIAMVVFDAAGTYRFTQRECHELMAYRTHRSLHNAVGTIRYSGGVIAGLTVNSNTAALRRPSVSDCVIQDEDAFTTNAAWADDSTYTQFYLSGAGGAANWATGAAEIVPVLAARPYYNQWTGATWQQTLMSTNAYQALWLVAIPTAKDDAADSLYRFVWVQGQSESTTLATIQALGPNNINLSALGASEFTVVGKVIIRYTASNWVITSYETVSGSRVAQQVSPSTVSTPWELSVPLSDLTTNLATGTNKAYWRPARDKRLTGVQASVLTAATGGTLLTVDIKANGVSILNTLITFDAGETTTTTATALPTLVTTAIAADDLVTFDITAVGSTLTGKGLIVTLYGYEA